MASLPMSCSKSGRFDGFELTALRGEPSSPAQFDRKNLYAADMAMGDLILRVDGHSQGFDRREVEVIHLCDMPLGV